MEDSNGGERWIEKNMSDKMNKTVQSLTTIVPSSDIYLHIFNVYALTLPIWRGHNDYTGKTIHLMTKFEENLVGL